MKRKQFEGLMQALGFLAFQLQRQADVMERSDARIEEQLAEAKRRQEERAAAIKRMFGPQVEVLPGEHPDEALVLDPSDPDTIKH